MVTLQTSSTIFALSSGFAKCAVSVIRVSGPSANSVFINMTKLGKIPQPRFAGLQTIVDPISNEHLDRAIAIWFPGPASYTGEDCCELQVHGSRAVISAIFEAFAKLKNFRPAEPGEFTKRAFYNGKLNLTEVEGLSDLLNAETELQRQQALIHVEKITSNLYERWSRTIQQNLAYVESYIEFSDEQLDDQIPTSFRHLTLHVSRQISELADSIKDYLSDSRKAERLKEGIRMVILGAPNVGKSSLLNILCKKQVAIVSEIAGTTRDTIERYIDIGGYPVILTDTAGIRNNIGENPVEVEGISRAYHQLQLADLLLIVTDANHYFKCNRLFVHDQLDLHHYVRYYTCTLQLAVQQQRRRPTVIVLNKIDRLTANEIRLLEHQVQQCSNDNRNQDYLIAMISCTHNERLNILMDLISQHLQQLCGNVSRNDLHCSQQRHRYHLEECLSWLNGFLNCCSVETFDVDDQEAELVVAIESLRSAGRSIAQLTGSSITIDHILDDIFQQFCIGK